ncbi:MAG: serine/threonine-protein kinase [Polyangiaceae bacterium]
MAAPDPFDGTPYRLLYSLGEGGMGEVYEVEHDVLGRTMVAKVLRAELAADSAVVDRMRVEAQALAALHHPNLVAVTDFRYTADGRPFYVMESLRGQSLGQALRARGTMREREAIDIARQILAGLHAAHGIGLVHRDIKPDNIYIHEPLGRSAVVKVLDFGVAKVGKSNPGGIEPPTIPTAEGAIVGTPRYVSPEQVLGRQIDHRADLYAVGLVLYSMVCGRGPFDDFKKAEELFVAHLKEAPPAPSQVSAQPVSAELEAVILRALEKDPARRFQNAEEFAEALSQCGQPKERLALQTTVEDNRPPPPTPDQVPLRKQTDAIDVPAADGPRDEPRYVPATEAGEEVDVRGLPAQKVVGSRDAEAEGGDVSADSPAQATEEGRRAAALASRASAERAPGLVATAQRSHRLRPYVAAAVTAVIVSGIGLVLVRRSPPWTAMIVFFFALAGAMGAARFASRVE